MNCILLTVWLGYDDGAHEIKQNRVWEDVQWATLNKTRQVSVRPSQANCSVKQGTIYYWKAQYVHLSVDTLSWLSYDLARQQCCKTVLSCFNGKMCCWLFTITYLTNSVFGKISISDNLCTVFFHAHDRTYPSLLVYMLSVVTLPLLCANRSCGDTVAVIIYVNVSLARKTKWVFSPHVSETVWAFSRNISEKRFTAARHLLCGFCQEWMKLNYPSCPV